MTMSKNGWESDMDDEIMHILRWIVFGNHLSFAATHPKQVVVTENEGGHHDFKKWPMILIFFKKIVVLFFVYI